MSVIDKTKCLNYTDLSTGIQTFCYCIYSLHFHPLSRFPGPFLAKLTDAYSAFRSYQGKMHIDIQECHRKYGKYDDFGSRKSISDREPKGKSFVMGQIDFSQSTLQTIRVCGGPRQGFSVTDQNIRRYIWAWKAFPQGAELGDNGALGGGRDDRDRSRQNPA